MNTHNIDIQEFLHWVKTEVPIGTRGRKECITRLEQAAIEADHKRRFHNGEALKRYKECGADEEQDPIERLQFFCSLAMSGQDWLDSEQFFDDLIADRKHHQETIEALEKEIESLAFNGSGLLAENKKLKTELKRRGISNECEPVAWEYPSDEWVKAFFGEPDESGFYYFRGDFGNIAYRYQKAARATAPQPAESCASLISDKTACGSENGNCDSQPAEPVKSHLKVSYDDKGDCLYVVCDSNEPADAEEDNLGILYRRAISDGRLVGVTIMNFMGPHAESRYGKGTP